MQRELGKRIIPAETGVHEQVRAISGNAQARRIIRSEEGKIFDQASSVVIRRAAEILRDTFLNAEISDSDIQRAEAAKTNRWYEVFTKP